MGDNIKTFYKNNKIDIEIVETIEGLQVDTIKIKIFDYNEKTLNKINKLVPSLCLYLKKDKINVKQDNKQGLLLFEIPKEKRSLLRFDDLQKVEETSKGLFVNLGKDTQKNDCIIDLTKSPHLLISGQTGSGKSVLLNNILTQLFFNYSPFELEAILIDVKKVELSLYRNIPHLLKKTIIDYNETILTFKNIIDDIDLRYEILEQSKTRNIQEYNKKADNKMKYKVLVIDELAELFMIENKSKLAKAINGGERLEDLITRVAQIGRACGVHLILATQRPSSDVITGLIKANIPARVALSVASGIDSRIILDEKGAENLTGKGDALVKLTGEDVKRFQAPFISDTEQAQLIDDIITKWKNKSNLQPEPPKQAQSKKELFFNHFVEVVNLEGFSAPVNDFIFYIKTEQGRKEVISNCYEDITDFETLKQYNEAAKDFEAIYKTNDAPQTIAPQKKQRRTIAGLGVPAFLLACFIGVCDGLAGNKRR